MRYKKHKRLLHSSYSLCASLIPSVYIRLNVDVFLKATGQPGGKMKGLDKKKL